MSEHLKIDLEKKFPLDFDKNAKVHFIAIGGIGVSAIAKCFLELGYKVSGADIKENKNTLMLQSLGAEIFIGHKAENLQNVGAVIASSAIKSDNPEVIEAQRLGLPIFHRSHGLDAIGRGLGKAKAPLFIGLSGTHGKTTTTGMTSLVLERSGCEPSVLIGGILPQIGTNGKAGQGDFMTAELDESDGTIVMYAPDITVITNLEVDHVDYFTEGMSQLLATFKKFTTNLHENAKLVINADNQGCMELYEQIDKSKVSLYSIEDKKADFVAKNIKLTQTGSSFDVYQDNNNNLGTIELSVVGLHNVSNALAVTIATLQAGISFENIQKALKEFVGTKRRFDFVGEYNSARIYDDYAHHPTEISATIKAAKQMNKRVLAIFQPHRYTRLQNFWEEFQESLKAADEIVVIDAYAAGDEPIEGITSKNFASQIDGAHYIEGNMSKVAEEVKSFIRPDDVVLTLGAGDITQVGYKICQI